MKKSVKLFGLLLSLVIMASCTNKQIDANKEQEAVRTTFNEFVKAIEKGDVDAYFSFLTDDFIGYDSGREAFTNSEEFKNEMRAFFKSNDFKLSKYSSQEVIVRDDIAIHRHKGVISIRPKNDTIKIELDVKYLDVLKKQKDGSWKIYIHSLNPNK